MERSGMSDAYSYEFCSPALEDYQRLRRLAGWDAFEPDLAETGLLNSVFSVIATTGTETVAMGRIIGDGAYLHVIVDVIVDPDHRGRGLGIGIVRRLVEFAETRLPDKSHLSLMADQAAQSLYAKLGFVDVAPEAVGMVLKRR